MKSFNQFIGESREESGRPVLDEILSRVEKPSSIINYFEKELGDDFLEFTSDSETGKKIEQEFSPRGTVREKKYESFMGSRSGFPYYYYIGKLGDDVRDVRMLSIRSGDSSTWWIRRSIVDNIDPSWLIDQLFRDF